MSFEMLGAARLTARGGTIASITVSPSTPSVEMGTPQQFTAVATDAKGNSFAPPSIVWSCTGSGSIDQTGLFTPTGPGSAIVTARVGSVSGQTPVTVTSTSNMPGAVSNEDEEEDDDPSETRDELCFPRQGFPSFHASPMEIDPQPHVFPSMLDHYPDMSDLELRPWPFDAAPDAAYEWAGVDEEENQFDATFEDEEGDDEYSNSAEVGHGGGGGGGGHGGGGHGHGGGGGGRGRRDGNWGYGGWGFGYPYMELADGDDDDLDADSIADLVVEKLSRREFANDAVVGDQVEDDARAIQDRAKQLATLKVVPIALALTLLKGGYAAEDTADKTGTTVQKASRAVTRGHLDWHRDALSKVAASPYVPYESADDLKKWVLQAYIDANLASEGRALAAANWAALWTDLQTAIANLPTDIAKTVHDTLVNTIASALGIPPWLVPIGGAILLGGVVYGAYKVLLIAAPVAIKAYTGKLAG